MVAINIHGLIFIVTLLLFGLICIYKKNRINFSDAERLISLFLVCTLFSFAMFDSYLLLYTALTGVLHPELSQREIQWFLGIAGIIISIFVISKFREAVEKI